MAVRVSEITRLYVTKTYTAADRAAIEKRSRFPACPTRGRNTSAATAASRFNFASLANFAFRVIRGGFAESGRIRTMKSALLGAALLLVPTATFAQRAKSPADAAVFIRIVGSIHADIDEFGVRRSVDLDRVEIGTGSGFVISPYGYVITNDHVVNETEPILITRIKGFQEAKITFKTSRIDVCFQPGSGRGAWFGSRVFCGIVGGVGIRYSISPCSSSAGRTFRTSHSAIRTPSPVGFRSTRSVFRSAAMWKSGRPPAYRIRTERQHHTGRGFSAAGERRR